MAGSLLESLVGLVNPSFVSRMAGQLGESDGAVAAGMRSSFAAILAGLLGKANDTAAMQQISNLIGGRADTTANPAAPEITTVAPAASSLLPTLFGGRTSTVADIVAQQAGLKLGSATSLMSMATPLVLGVLGEKAGNGNAASLASTLLAQKDEILHALPTGLGSMLGLGGVGEFANNAGTGFSTPAAAATIPRVPDPVATSGNRWLIPLVTVIVVLLILWFFYGRNREPESVPASQTMHNAIDSTSAAARYV